MIIRPNLRWLLLPLVLLCAPIARADAPSGTLDYSFDTEIASPIIDLTGGYVVAVPIVGPDGVPVDVFLGLDLTQDGRGRLSGGGFNIVAWGTDLVAGDYSVSGKISRSGFNTKVKLTVRVTGFGIIAGQATEYRLVLNINGFVDLESGEIFGKANARANLQGLGRARGKTSDFLMGIPANMDGSWDLTLNVAPGISPLGGTGAITLSNGRVLNFDLSGRYSPASDSSKLKLMSIGTTDRGSTLNLILDGFLDVVGMGGKVMGQKMH